MSNQNYSIGEVGISDIGHVRALNEDAFFYQKLSDGELFVVCDGMGGHNGGDIASNAAVRYIHEYFNNNPNSNPEITIREAIKFANQQIYYLSRTNKGHIGMGTTAVVLFIQLNSIYIAHAGDSRIYVVNNKKLLKLTKDHSVVQEMVDKGIIKEEDAESHPRKNEITQALGIREFIEPTVATGIRSKKGDRFILCSDGLSGLISHDLFESTVNSNNNPHECAIKLVDFAKKAGGHDNITVQIVDIIKSPFKKSNYPSAYNLPKLPGDSTGQNPYLIHLLVLILGITLGVIFNNLYDVLVKSNFINLNNFFENRDNQDETNNSGQEVKVSHKKVKGNQKDKKEKKKEEEQETNSKKSSKVKSKVTANQEKKGAYSKSNANQDNSDNKKSKQKNEKKQDVKNTTKQVEVKKEKKTDDKKPVNSEENSKESVQKNDKNPSNND
jgi:serine/threonine protein phosphatase PrpC